ncbi:MAG: cytochrome c maturation protein CcmE [Pseudomonadota bacterium]|nr:cytochrome c maturation protein CcmE [Pseudomonadota bacterium]
MKTKWVIGLAVIAAAVLVISLVNLGGNLVYFYTPSEAFAAGENLRNKNIKIGGMVMAGSVEEQTNDEAAAGKHILRFTITDFKGHNIKVKHTGIAPDLFREGQGVVAEGYFDATNKAMKTHTLMVKHSEEYRVPHDNKIENKELLIKSLLED